VVLIRASDRWFYGRVLGGEQENIWLAEKHNQIDLANGLLGILQITIYSVR
jgi:hypothetical protein